MTNHQPQLHPDLAPFATLLGSWTGTGHGDYPSIDAFDYAETITFGHVGKPFLSYGQRTRALAEPGQPLHAESGYWRFPSTHAVEIMLSHPTGLTEIEEGTIATDEAGVIVIETHTSTIGRSTTAKSVTVVTRWFRIDGDRIDYRVDMAAEGHPLQQHLVATLTRD